MVCRARQSATILQQPLTPPAEPLPPQKVTAPPVSQEKIERNREIVRLLTEENLSSQAVGVQYGISQQRVQQIAHKYGATYAQRFGTRHYHIPVDIPRLQADHLAYLEGAITRLELLRRHGIKENIYKKHCRQQGWVAKKAHLATRTTKRCTRCGVEKPATAEYYPRTYESRSLRAICKACQALYYQQRKGARKQAKRQQT